MPFTVSTTVVPLGDGEATVQVDGWQTDDGTTTRTVVLDTVAGQLELTPQQAGALANALQQAAVAAA